MSDKNFNFLREEFVQYKEAVGPLNQLLKMLQLTEFAARTFTAIFCEVLAISNAEKGLTERQRLTDRQKKEISRIGKKPGMGEWVSVARDLAKNVTKIEANDWTSLSTAWQTFDKNVLKENFVVNEVRHNPVDIRNIVLHGGSNTDDVIKAVTRELAKVFDDEFENLLKSLDYFEFVFESYTSSGSDNSPGKVFLSTKSKRDGEGDEVVSKNLLDLWPLVTTASKGVPATNLYQSTISNTKQRFTALLDDPLYWDYADTVTAFKEKYLPPNKENQPRWEIMQNAVLEYCSKVYGRRRIKTVAKIVRCIGNQIESHNYDPIILSGKAGYGKSAVMSAVCYRLILKEKRREEKRQKNAIGSKESNLFFWMFRSRDSGEFNSRIEFMSGFLEKFNNLKNKELEQEELEAIGSAITKHQVRIENEFNRLVENLKKPVIIVIDGVDEAEKVDYEFTEWLNQLGAYPKIQLVVFGRPTAHYIRQKNADSIMLLEQVEVQDAEVWLKSAFQEHASAFRKRDGTNWDDELLRQACKKADGSALYLALMIRDLGPRPTIDTESVAKWPDGLISYFDDLVSRRTDSSLIDTHIFNILAASGRKMPESALRSTVALAMVTSLRSLENLWAKALNESEDVRNEIRIGEELFHELYHEELIQFVQNSDKNKILQKTANLSLIKLVTKRLKDSKITNKLSDSDFLFGVKAAPTAIGRIMHDSSEDSEDENKKSELIKIWEDDLANLEFLELICQATNPQEPNILNHWALAFLDMYQFSAHVTGVSDEQRSKLREFAGFTRDLHDQLLLAPHCIHALAKQTSKGGFLSELGKDADVKFEWQDDEYLPPSYRLFRGHTAPISDALVDPEWGLVSWDSVELIQWTDDGKVKRWFDGHKGFINGVLVDATWGLVSWDRKGELIQWNADGTIKQRYEVHQGTVSGSLFNPVWGLVSWDDRQIIQGTVDGTVKRRFDGHEGLVGGALVDPMWGLVSWDDRQIIQWTVDGKVKRRFDGHEGWVIGALVDPEWGLVSWDSERQLIRWDADGTVKQRFDGHKGFINGVLVDATWGLVSWDDGELIQWNADGTVKERFRGHTSDVTGALVDATWGLVSWDDSQIIQWATERTDKSGFERYTGFVAGSLFDPVWGFVSWDDGELIQWNVDGKVKRRFDGHKGWVIGALVDLEWGLVSWDRESQIIQWTVDGKVKRRFDGHKGWVIGALVDPEWGLVSWDGVELIQWTVDGKVKRRFDRHKGWVFEDSLVGALVDSEWGLVSWDRKGELIQWNVDGKVKRRFDGHKGFINGVLVDATWGLVSWDNKGELIQWTVDGTVKRRFDEHKGWVRGALVDPVWGLVSWDHRQIIQWTVDGTVKRRFDRHKGFINGVLVDATWGLVSWNAEGDLIQWTDDGTIKNLLQGSVLTVQNGWAFIQMPHYKIIKVQFPYQAAPLP
jgi:hypothetical protein